MTPEQRQERLKDMRSQLRFFQMELGVHQNAVSRLEAEIYRQEGDIERLENEGGSND